MTEIKAGIYRHYKGQHYLVLGLAHDANADDLYLDAGPVEWPNLEGRLVVVYIPLQMDGAHTGPPLAVRTLEDFNAMVCATKGHPGYGTTNCKHFEFHEVPRFTYVGTDRTEDMIVTAGPPKVTMPGSLTPGTTVTVDPKPPLCNRRNCDRFERPVDLNCIEHFHHFKAGP